MNPYLFGAFDLGGGAGDEVGRALAHVRVVLRQADGPHAADAALAHVPEGEDGLSQDLLNTRNMSYMGHRGFSTSQVPYFSRIFY